MRCGDLTEIVTGEGKLYLATVLDLFSRRCLGCAFSPHHDADRAEEKVEYIHRSAQARGTKAS